MKKLVVLIFFTLITFVSGCLQLNFEQTFLLAEWNFFSSNQIKKNANNYFKIQDEKLAYSASECHLNKEINKKIIDSCDNTLKKLIELCIPGDNFTACSSLYNLSKSLDNSVSQKIAKNKMIESDLLSDDVLMLINLPDDATLHGQKIFVVVSPYN